MTTEANNSASPMTAAEAKSIVGNQPMWAINNMIRALKLLPALNTAEDNIRLEAAKLVVADRKLQKARRSK
jgi:hypothetical protein